MSAVTFKSDSDKRYVGTQRFTTSPNDAGREKSKYEFNVTYDGITISAISVYMECTDTVGTRTLALYIYDPDDYGNAYFYQEIGTLTAEQSKTFILSPHVETSESADALGLNYVNIPNLAHGKGDRIFVQDDSDIDAEDEMTLTFKFVTI